MLRSQLYVLKSPFVALPQSPSIDDVVRCLDGAENNEPARQFLDTKESFTFLTSTDKDWTLYLLSPGAEDPYVLNCETLVDRSRAQRIPEGFANVQSRKVGIVGCGSLGSKVAMQLVRSGILSFLLIDGDIFFEGNLVRNELTTSDVGFHKSRALRMKMLEVNPSAEIATRQIKLGGQESGESIASAMAQLAECNLEPVREVSE
jgi:hypothetical protein